MKCCNGICANIMLLRLVGFDLGIKGCDTSWVGYYTIHVP